MTDAASETRGGFPDVRPVEDAPAELDRFVAALRQLQDLTVSTRPDNALWTGSGNILNQRLAPNYDNVAWQSPEVGNSFGRFVATATRNNQPCVFSSAQHAVVGLAMTPPTTPTPTPNPRATPRPRPTPAPRP